MLAFKNSFGLLALLSLVSCFGGVKKTGKVIDYKPGKVMTKKGGYQVGPLGASWRRVSLGIAAITFRNRAWQSSISTDAYCDQAYDDAPLAALTRHLFAGLQEIRVESEESIMLDGRGALRTSLQATLDGVPVRLQTVVIKKNECLFDFYLVSPPEYFLEALSDFESFYQGFAYAGDL